PAARNTRPASIMIWKTLTQMEPTAAKPPEDVIKLFDKEVAIVGFVIPNDAEDITAMHEFLLTPMAGGCIHVPPPPPNYVVHVSMMGDEKTKIPFGAVEVRGVLTLPKYSKDRNFYSFELVADSVRDFNADDYMQP
ncbi:MAG: DUF3299 domain-containing protein, partial [Bdellovibrionota bacterium]